MPGQPLRLSGGPEASGLSFWGEREKPVVSGNVTGPPQ